jgi:hypothetical protein
VVEGQQKVSPLLQKAAQLRKAAEGRKRKDIRRILEGFRSYRSLLWMQSIRDVASSQLLPLLRERERETER